MRSMGCKLALVVGFAMCAAEAIAQSPGVVAQAHARGGDSFMMWLLKSFGLFGLLTVVSGIAIFIGALFVVVLARRPAVVAAYLPFLALPSMLAIFGALKGLIASFAVIAMSDVQLKQSEISAGWAEALVLPMSALMITFPSYFVVTIGLFVRTLMNRGPATLGGKPAAGDR